MATSTEFPVAAAAGEPMRAPSRARTRWARGLVWFAVLVTGLCALLVASSVKNDLAIESRTGRAEAEVLVTELRRTLVVYTTPDGTVHSPSNGVQYPAGLKPGDVVRVEYDRLDPELVRVAGRGASTILLPVGSTLLGVWAICLALAWWLRRPGARPRTPAR